MSIKLRLECWFYIFVLLRTEDTTNNRFSTCPPRDVSVLVSSPLGQKDLSSRNLVKVILKTILTSSIKGCISLANSKIVRFVCPKITSHRNHRGSAFKNRCSFCKKERKKGSQSGQLMDYVYNKMSVCVNGTIKIVTSFAPEVVQLLVFRVTFFYYLMVFKPVVDPCQLFFWLWKIF